MSELLPSYEWYKLLTVKEYDALNVPDYKRPDTIKRQHARILKSMFTSLRGERIELLTVSFNDEFISLKSFQDESYVGELGLVKFKGAFYIGFAL